MHMCVRGIEFAPFYDFWNCSNSYDIFVLLSIVLQEEFEDTKGVIRIRKPKTDNTMAKRKRTKGQTMIYKTYT